MKNNVPSRLSPQWLCGNSCTWAHDTVTPTTKIATKTPLNIIEGNKFL